MSTNIEKLEKAIKDSSRVLRAYVGESITYGGLTSSIVDNIREGAKDSFDIINNSLNKRLEKLILTREELEALDFFKASDDLYLIPIWMFNFLNRDINVKCVIDGKIEKISDINKDHELGYIAYGIMPKERIDEDE